LFGAVGQIGATSVNSWIEVPLSRNLTISQNAINLGIEPTIDDSVFFDSRESGLTPVLIVEAQQSVSRTSTQSSSGGSGGSEALVAEPTPGSAPSPTPNPISSSSPSATSNSQRSADTKKASPVVTAVGNALAKASRTATDAVKQVAEDDQSAKVIAPLAVAAAAVPAAATAASALPYLGWWNIPAAFMSLIRRKRTPWGVVYDSKTKEPLDPVVITLISQSGQHFQTISDIYGRYEFLVEPGTYILTAKKSHYKFPSTTIIDHDDVYENVYHGQSITVDSDNAILFNIPMDQVEGDWNQNEKRKMGMSRWHLSYAFILMGQSLFWLGLLWSLLAVYISPSVLNSLLVCFYAAMLIVRNMFRLRQPWGTIKKKGRPLEGAIVRLINPAFPQVRRAPVVTKASGRYTFLVDRGEYQLSVEERQSDGTIREVYHSPSIQIKQAHGHINRNVTMA
jgi:hypothetical protein